MWTNQWLIKLYAQRNRNSLTTIKKCTDFSSWPLSFTNDIVELSSFALNGRGYFAECGKLSGGNLRKIRLEWRFRVPIGNNGAMHFSGYPEVYNHAHSLHVYFWHNLGTVYSSAYPELCKHAHLHLVWFSNNLCTMYFNAYPDVHKSARSLLVYFFTQSGYTRAQH